MPCHVRKKRVNIKEVLHAKRVVTEEHIKQLQKDGCEGVHYTVMMSDIPFLVLTWLCDIRWPGHMDDGWRIFKFCYRTANLSFLKKECLWHTVNCE